MQLGICLVLRCLRHALPREERLSWLIKIALAVVAARPYRVLGVAARCDTFPLTHAVLPVNGSFGGRSDLVFDDFIGARSNLGRVIDQSTHFADITRHVSTLVNPVDYGSEEARWDAWDRHLLEAGVTDRSGRPPR